MYAVERVGRTWDTAAGGTWKEAILAVSADVFVRTRQAVDVCACNTVVVVVAYIDGLSVVELAAVRIGRADSTPSNRIIAADCAVLSIAWTDAPSAFLVTAGALRQLVHIRTRGTVGVVLDRAVAEVQVEPCSRISALVLQRPEAAPVLADRVAQHRLALARYHRELVCARGARGRSPGTGRAVGVAEVAGLVPAVPVAAFGANPRVALAVHEDVVSDAAGALRRRVVESPAGRARPGQTAAGQGIVVVASRTPKQARANRPRDDF